MPRSLRLTALCALCLLASLLTPVSSAADATLFALAEPESNFAIGIDVQALMLSPLAQEAMLKAQTENPTWGDTLGALGPNPLSRIQEVLIAGDVEAAREDSQGLVLVRGDFADDTWITAVCQSGCANESYQGFTLQTLTSADKPSAFVRLDSNYVAVGSPDKVRGAIDRRRSSTSSAFASQVNSWTTNTRGHHLWIAAKGPFDMPHAGADPMGMSNLANLRAFGMGLTVGTDLEVGLEMRSNTDAESLVLHQTLQGLLMMMSASAQQDPDTAALLNGLSINQSAQTVTASLRVPGYLIKRMAEKRAQQAMTMNAEPDYTQPAPRPRQPRQGVIRIEGLEGGPVVVESEQPTR